jgi:excisionase family DNA binding protein
MASMSNANILTVEEYAEHLRVCRTTVFQWIKNGNLKPGLHYIKIGRCLRFLWDPDTIKGLHDINSADTDIPPQRIPVIRQSIKKRKRISIDMSY